MEFAWNAIFLIITLIPLIHSFVFIDVIRVEYYSRTNKVQWLCDGYIVAFITNVDIINLPQDPGNSLELYLTCAHHTVCENGVTKR